AARQPSRPRVVLFSPLGARSAAAASCRRIASGAFPSLSQPRQIREALPGVAQAIPLGSSRRDLPARRPSEAVGFIAGRNLRMSASFANMGTLRNEWFALSLVVAIAAGIAVLYASSVTGIVSLWENSDYRHCALVLPISAYLLWRVRAVLAGVKI